MSGITNKDLEELFELTIKDLPLPPVEEMLCISCDSMENAKVIGEFIEKHYTLEQIEKGMDKLIERLKFIKQLFGEK